MGRQHKLFNIFFINDYSKNICFLINLIILDLVQSLLLILYIMYEIKLYLMLKFYSINLLIISKIYFNIY